MENTPNLSVFREVLKTDPIPGEEKIAEGLRYWVMKENGTLPVREKPASLSGMAAVCDSPIVLVVEAKKEEKLSFGKKLASFFGF